MSIEFKTIEDRKDLEKVKEGDQLQIVAINNKKNKGIYIRFNGVNLSIMTPSLSRSGLSLFFSEEVYGFGKEGFKPVLRYSRTPNEEDLKKYRHIFGEVTKNVWKDQQLWA